MCFFGGRGASSHVRIRTSRGASDAPSDVKRREAPFMVRPAKREESCMLVVPIDDGLGSRGGFAVR